MGARSPPGCGDAEALDANQSNIRATELSRNFPPFRR